MSELNDRYIWVAGDFMVTKSDTKGARVVVKYNENHDPQNGEFTTGDGGDDTHAAYAVAIQGSKLKVKYSKKRKVQKRKASKAARIIIRK